MSVTLQSILSKAFPEDYSSRAAEAAAAAAAAAGGGGSSGSNGSRHRVTLPLFVMSTLVPGEKMALNIFEPRCVCWVLFGVRESVCVCGGG